MQMSGAKGPSPAAQVGAAPSWWASTSSESNPENRLLATRNLAPRTHCHLARQRSARRDTAESQSIGSQFRLGGSSTTQGEQYVFKRGTHRQTWTTRDQVLTFAQKRHGIVQVPLPTTTTSLSDSHPIGARCVIEDPRLVKRQP